MYRQSGKFSIAYMAQGGEKEYYVASACEEVYIPESASLSLRGLAVAGLFCHPCMASSDVHIQCDCRLAIQEKTFVCT